jgi:hypothetical protein
MLLSSGYKSLIFFQFINRFIHDFLIGIKTDFVDETTLLSSNKSPAPRISKSFIYESFNSAAPKKA